MNKPMLQPILRAIVRRDKSKDIVYVPLNCVRKGVQQGYFYDTNGMKIMDPLKIFNFNNMPKFSDINEMFVFLQKVDYEKWKGCSYDADFVLHHIDIVRKMYVTTSALKKKKENFELIYDDLKTKIELVIALFYRDNNTELRKFKKLFYNLYGDDYTICSE